MYEYRHVGRNVPYQNIDDIGTTEISICIRSCLFLKIVVEEYAAIDITTVALQDSHRLPGAFRDGGPYIFRHPLLETFYALHIVFYDQ